MQSVESLFELDALVDVVRRCRFQRIVLQFPDEYLVHCVSAYQYLADLLGSDVHLFIAADSTFGSSVDDVSAQHVDGDALVYFGSDLSASGVMPVIVLPYVVPFSVKICAEKLCSEANAYLPDVCSRPLETPTPVLLVFEPGCHRQIQELAELLNVFDNRAQIITATLPKCANLKAWLEQSEEAIGSSASDDVRIEAQPQPQPQTPKDIEVVGGLLVSHEIMQDPRLQVWYIGDKTEQFESILLQLADKTVLRFSPSSNQVHSVVGQDTRRFRERYGGVARVKDANVVGIIIGSMGLTAEATNGASRRLHRLIEAAGKKCYTFVMGRLNEAKLCNFPEVHCMNTTNCMNAFIH